MFGKYLRLNEFGHSSTGSRPQLSFRQLPDGAGICRRNSLSSFALKGNKTQELSDNEGTGMFNLAPFVAAVLAVIVGIAAFTDLRERRIPNWLVLAGLLAGFALNINLYG